MNALATENTKDSKSWPRVKLGEVCDVTAGNSAPQDEILFEGGKFPFVRTSDVGEIHFGIICDTRDKLNEEGIRKLRLFPKGSLLFPKSGASTFLDHRVILGIDAYVASHLAVVIPDNTKVYSGYLLLALAEVKAKDLMQDSSYPSLRPAEIASIEIELPPLAVQHEIVARLEKELAMVERMAKGFEALKNEADQLFKSTLKETFEEVSRGGAEIKSLDEIFVKISDGTHRTPSYCDDSINGVKFLSSKDVTSGKIDWKNIRYIPQGLHQELCKRIAPQRGDILLAKNGTTGVAAVVDTDEVFDIYVSLALLRPSPGNVIRYLWYAINSPYLKEQFDGSLKGMGVPNLHLIEIRKACMPLPSRPSQDKIVAKLDAVRERCEKLKRAAEEGAQTAALMRKAILKEAFA